VTILAALARWLLRHALVFVMLVAALAVHAHFRTERGTARGLTASIERLSGAETFRPYLFGLEPLLKDSIADAALKLSGF
jgi:hypothetical protein